jgi:hypothetical protein
MVKRKQPIEALIVQYFHEAALDACESVHRIVTDILKRRRQTSIPATVKGRKRRTSQKSLAPNTLEPDGKLSLRDWLTDDPVIDDDS